MRIRNAKRTIMLFVLLLMVIGAAVVTTTLISTGRTIISSNEEEYDVYFSKSYLDGNDITLSSISTDGKKITFKAKDLKGTGDKSVLEYEVTNSSKQYGAKIEMNCISEGDEYLSFKNEFNYDYIGARESKVGILTVEQKKSTISQREYNIECEIISDATELTERVEEVEVPVGKTTDYSLYGYFVDENQVKIPNATLVVYSETPHYVKTDTRGYFYVGGLEEGTHEIYYLKEDIEEVKNFTKENIKEKAYTNTNFTTSTKVLEFENKQQVTSEIGDNTEKEIAKVEYDARGGSVELCSRVL